MGSLFLKLNKTVFVSTKYHFLSHIKSYILSISCLNTPKTLLEPKYGR